jgi:hypothetical protein
MDPRSQTDRFGSSLHQLSRVDGATPPAAGIDQHGMRDIAGGPRID